MHESDCGSNDVISSSSNDENSQHSRSVRHHELVNYANELNDASDDYSTNRDF